MGKEETDRESAGTPIIFPAIPWLRDGTKYDAYLESSLAHARNQDVEGVEILPIYMTETIDDDIVITSENQMSLVTPKLNEIVEACPEEATHVWFLNADNEVPPHALRYLLEHDADVASGVSPLHQSWKWMSAVHWIPAPTRQLMGSTPYFKPFNIGDIEGKVVGEKELVASGHFCLLVKKHVFDNIWFRWEPYKMRTCLNCGEKVKCVRQNEGSEYTFWMDAYMLGYKCRIDGRVVCGHLPQWPLSEYNTEQQ